MKSIGLAIFLFALFIGGFMSEAKAQAMISPKMAELFQVGRTFSGVKIPSYSKTDALQMVLEADTITRVDSTYLDITNLIIKVYAKGKVESTIKMEEAKYNLLTNELESKPTKKRPEVLHPSFVMTGDTMIVDTKNSVSTMRGRVRVVIPDAHKFTGNFGLPMGDE